MPKRIILVRHGETDFNRESIIQGHTDTFLNKTGVSQATAVAKLLVKEKIDAIYSSDLRRAFQTAWFIGQKLKREIITTRYLRERNFSDFEALKKEEAKKIHSNFAWDRGFEDPVSQFFKIETDRHMEQRINKFLRQLKRLHSNQHILLVTHGGIIWTFLKILALDKEIPEESDPFINTSVTVLRKQGRGYKLKLKFRRSNSAVSGIG